MNISKLKLYGSNSISLGKKDIINSKVKVAESELLRILKHLEGVKTSSDDKDGYELNSIISLKVGKNSKRYDKLIARKRFKGTLNLLEIENGHIQRVNTYVSQFTGAGHSRCQKSLFIKTDHSKQVDEICRCGIPEDIYYDKPSKWNAYYAMVATDSIPVINVPNIIVVEDFQKNIMGNVDVVEEYLNKSGIRDYKVLNDILYNTPIKPFDGAGLVTPQCAKQWSMELDCQDSEKKRYIPSAYQFRAIPGIKGNLYVADIYEFAKQFGVYEIVDIWGKVWDINQVKVDCIMTKSQFKFADLYVSYEHWLNEFQKQLYGYRRTFNISEYSEAPIDLKERILLSYQPLQTILFTPDEMRSITEKTIEKYKSICTNVDDFIKYRGMTSYDENDDGENKKRIPPYYKALLQNKELFNDSYIKGKIKDDIRGLRNKILSGKTFVDGNYQILTIDVYAMLEYVFGLPVIGLLQENEIYSSYWNERFTEKEYKDREVDIIRNPHIATEHRIGKLVNTEKMKEWYKYQNTGIITGIHDTILLTIGGADCDGDHVGTISDLNIINAVKREIQSGHARTIVFEPLKKENKDMSVSVNDVFGLMAVNQKSFKNDIGDVVNEISKLWSMELTDEIREAIKVMSIIGGLTIDFAKTGEVAEIPDRIKELLKPVKKPYFMRYFHKNRNLVTREEQAIRNIHGLEMKLKNRLGLEELQTKIEKEKRFSDSECNVNLLSHHYEKELMNIEFFMDNIDNEFCVSLIRNPAIPINRKIKSELLQLHSLFQEYGRTYNMSYCKTSDEKRECESHYDYFYEYCREQLLSIECNIDKLLDILLKIYYKCPEYERKSKDILWNSFADELYNRVKNGDNIYDFKDEQRRKEYLKSNKSELKAKCSVEKSFQNAKGSKALIKLLDLDIYKDNIIVFTDADKRYINKHISTSNKIVNIKKNDIVGIRRLFAVLLVISRKIDPVNAKYITKSSKKNGLSDTAINKMTKIDKRKILPSLSILEELKLIEINRRNMTEIKIKVQYWVDKSENSTELYNNTDYNNAASIIRYIFR